MAHSTVIPCAFMVCLICISKHMSNYAMKSYVCKINIQDPIWAAIKYSFNHNFHSGSDTLSIWPVLQTARLIVAAKIIL